MPDLIKIPIFLMLLLLFLCLGTTLNTMASDFSNPVLKTPAGCQADNLRAERFASEINLEDRIKLCLALDKITAKLNNDAWSPALLDELAGIWGVFSNEAVTVKLMPKETSLQIFAEAVPLNNNNHFEAILYLRPEKIYDDPSFPVLFHELRHIYDFYRTWENKTKINPVDLENRASLLISKLDRETAETKHSNLPKY